MKKNLSKRILAYLLVVMLAVPASFCAFADPQEYDGYEKTLVVVAGPGDEKEVTVIGDVVPEDTTGNTETGVLVQVEEGTADVTVTGNVVVDTNDDNGYGLSVYASSGGEATVTVNKDVTVDAEKTATGVDVSATDATVDVSTGDVTVSSNVENEYIAAVNVATHGEKADADVWVGDVEAEAIGVRVNATGGDADVTTGSIEAEQNGLAVNFIESRAEKKMEESEFKALNLGQSNKEDRTYASDGKSYSYTKFWTVGDTEYRASGDYNESNGTITNQRFVKLTNEALPGDVTVNVNGDIDVKSDDHDAAGIIVQQDGKTPASNTNITVHGDVNAETEGGRFSAAGVAVYGDYKTTNEDYVITITGNVNAHSEDGQGATGISLIAYEGSEGIVSVGGEVKATLTGGESAGVSGVNAYAYNGGEITVDIGKGVYAGTEEDIRDVSATGITAYTVSGPPSEIDIDVHSGDVVAVGETATGISVHDCSGDIEINVENGSVIAVGESATGIKSDVLSGDVDITVNGDVISTGTGLNISASGGLYYENGKVTENVPVSETEIKVLGDVSADETGILISDVNKNAKIDILVDGTVSGDNSAVAVASGTILDNVTLTVWEIKPNENGSVADTMTQKFNQETKRYDKEYTENEEFEKQIQYIIKMEPNENATLYTEGTTEYEGYNVAHEGDTVILKVNVADGYHIVNAYNGTDTKVELLRDENGDYYLVVPRGGAVLLSVTLEADAPAAPAPVVEEEEEAPAAPVYTYVPPKATMPKVGDSAETAAFKEKINTLLKNGGDIFSILPDAIKALIPEGFKKLSELLTLELLNYKDNMGEISFVVETKKTYTEGEEAFVVFVIPGDNETYLTAKAVGMADGTLKITPDAETLKQLANKKFVAMILEKEEVAK